MQYSNKDFFVSYSSSDKNWAEWIAWVLEEHGYSVVIKAWDFRPGGNWVLDIQSALSNTKCTIMLLSETYLNSPHAKPEWAAAFVQDVDTSLRRLLPIKVKPCQPTGLLASIQCEDLTMAMSEIEAQNRLLSAVRDGRIKPSTRPPFPEPLPDSERIVPNRVEFPGLSGGMAAAATAAAAASLLSFSDDQDQSDHSSRQHEDNRENTLEDVFQKIADKYGFHSLLSETTLDEELGKTLEKIVDRYDLNSLARDFTIQFDQHETITISQENVQSVSLSDGGIDSNVSDEHDDHYGDDDDDIDDEDLDDDDDGWDDAFV